MASMVAPAGARSIARIRACLLSARSVCFAEDRCRGPTPGRVPRLSLTGLWAVVCAGLFCLAGLLLFEYDRVRRFELGLRIDLLPFLRRHLPPPPKPHVGDQAGGAGFRNAPIDRNWSHDRSVCAGKPVLSG